MEAVQAAVSRITRRGTQLGPDDLAVSLDTALRAHTISAARALGREEELGSIEAGKRADFAVLDRDPHMTPVSELARVGVTETWVGGERVFAR
jgi:predicted amidohydrolase YtcJ